MPNYSNGQVFSYGDVARNVNSIKNRNALTQSNINSNEIDDQYRRQEMNALNNPEPYDPRFDGIDKPTSQMKNDQYRAYLVDRGATAEELRRFDNAVAREWRGKIGEVQHFSSGGSAAQPMAGATLQGEGDASAYMANRKQGGEMDARAGIRSDVPLSSSELTLPVQTATPPSEASLAGDKAASQELAKAEVQYKWKGIIAAEVKKAEAAATERGEVLNDLQRMEASLPALKQSVAELTKLATASTSTMAGKGYDILVKEMGFGSTEGATAQAKFIAIVNNQVLPLLRQTFGAAFTAVEGESLKKTMGDPNASPEVKMAQLDAFITQKVRDIESKKNQIQAIDETTSGISDEEKTELEDLRAWQAQQKQ
jgi:hypothetical protein